MTRARGEVWGEQGGLMEDKSGTLGGCGLVSAVGDVRIAGERPAAVDP